MKYIWLVRCYQPDFESEGGGWEHRGRGPPPWAGSGAQHVLACFLGRATRHCVRVVDLHSLIARVYNVRAT